MRTASAHERPRAAARAVDPQLLVARWSAALLGLAGFAALLPSTVLPNGVPLVVLLAGLAAILFARVPPRSMRFDLVSPFSALFAALGLLYIAASVFQLLPAGNLRPVKSEFIPRHAYFVFIWIPLMAGSTALFRNVLPDIVRLVRAGAVPVLFFLAVADLLSAIFLGDPAKIVWEKYTSFLDPSALTFVYVAAFFLYVATTRRIAAPLAIATAHCVVSSVSNYGMMYNTMTGMFVFVCMWVFALTIRRSPRVAFFSVLALGGGLVLGLAAGAAAPALIGFDLNTQWRFLVWRENLFAALDSGLLGVGFGTPYYQLSAGNIAEAFRLSKFSEFAQHAMSSPIDILYIRGQHSSFVNAFYRMGVLGGGLLIAFNAAVLLVLMRALRRGTGILQRVAAAGAAVFIAEASQVAMHVGIESPRYFAMYGLAVGLARAAAHLASTGEDA